MTQQPVSPTDAPLFSVMTVCFNALPVLCGSLASLRQQQLSGRAVQGVVVDGRSTDGSVQWLALQRPDVFISEPDAGIYDAMNKAAALATGEWLYFLNAGDAFADATVLADVARAAAAIPALDIVFGDVLYVGPGASRRKRFHWVTRRRLLFGDLCHQAVFVRRALFQRIGPFDASLRWNADFDWFVRAFGAGARLHYMQRDIARFDDGGAHVQAGARSEAERNTVRARYLPLPLWRLGNLALRVELRLRRIAGKIV